MLWISEIQIWFLFFLFSIGLYDLIEKSNLLYILKSKSYLVIWPKSKKLMFYVYVESKNEAFFDNLMIHKLCPSHTQWSIEEGCGAISRKLRITLPNKSISKMKHRLKEQ